MENILVRTSQTTYPIMLGSGLLESSGAHEALRDFLAGRSLLIVSDSNVGPLYGHKFRRFALKAGARKASLVTIPAGEQSKNLDMLRELYSAALSEHLDRDCLIAALGGGVAGDLAGFAAATFMRGVDYMQVPTSLLAMVDSSVGGKVGVDLEEGKNLAGAFHHPRMVLTDLDVLKTLPDRELRCGLAEIIKYGLIMDADLFQRLDKNTDRLLDRDRGLYTQVVKRCCELKAQVVFEDEREASGRRAILNYGHTFGHALECLTGYKALNHGEAVAIGMTAAAELGVGLGMASPSFIEAQDRLLSKLDLPTDGHRYHLSADAIFEAMCHDKKARDGAPRFILPREIGAVELVENVPKKEILKAIRRRCEQS